MVEGALNNTTKYSLAPAGAANPELEAGGFDPIPEPRRAGGQGCRRRLPGCSLRGQQELAPAPPSSYLQVEHTLILISYTYFYVRLIDSTARIFPTSNNTTGN